MLEFFETEKSKLETEQLVNARAIITKLQAERDEAMETLERAICHNEYLSERMASFGRIPKPEEIPSNPRGYRYFRTYGHSKSVSKALAILFNHFKAAW